MLMDFDEQYVLQLLQGADPELMIVVEECRLNQLELRFEPKNEPGYW